MNLRLEREPSTENATIGRLLNADLEAWLCYTLEDVVRDVKVYGVTAIPAGRYRLIMTWSDKFKRRLPLLLDVPNYTGVRIHSGNRPQDTEGCILVGFHRGTDIVLESRAALRMLTIELEEALLAGTECWITIV